MSDDMIGKKEKMESDIKKSNQPAQISIFLFIIVALDGFILLIRGTPENDMFFTSIFIFAGSFGAIFGLIALGYGASESYNQAKESIKIKLKRRELEKKRAETKRKEEKEIRAKEREQARDYDNAIEIWEELGKIEEAARVRKEKANEREQARDYDNAIEIWEELGEIDEAARVRKIREEMGSVKVAQSVVQGDQITEVKDSVISKSNIGTGEDDKIAKLEKIAEMKDKGIIDDDEFKQMKKEILGK